MGSSWSSVFNTVETSCCVGILWPFDIFQVILGIYRGLKLGQLIGDDE